MRKLVSYLMDEMKQFTLAVNTEHLKVLRFLEYYVEDGEVVDKGVWLTVEVSYRNRGRNKYSINVIDKANIESDGRLVYMIRKNLSEYEMMALVERLIMSSTWEKVETDQ